MQSEILPHQSQAKQERDFAGKSIFYHHSYQIYTGIFMQIYDVQKKNRQFE